MKGDGGGRVSGAGSLISVAEDLQRLRHAAGAVSYAEIATRVTSLRAVRSGRSSVPVSRSTVYDAFRPGRTRLDADLVVDIVRSLGVADADAESWRDRCMAAKPAAPRPSPRVGTASGAEAPPVSAASVLRLDAPRPAGRRVALIVGVMIGAVLFNVAGGRVVLWLDLPLYLDMVGTAVVAVALGPWYAVATAVITQLGGALVNQSTLGLPFTPVAVVGALLWGYGVHRWGWGRSLSRFLLLSVVVAVACTVVAAPITDLVYGGFSAHVAGNSLTARFRDAGMVLPLAIAIANLITSLLDKLIASFVALSLAAPIRRWITKDRDPSPDLPPMVLFAGRRPSPALYAGVAARRASVL
ncbi:energy-coupling factor transport system substrate-specific component [Microbacterium sp. SORGH_AS 862]|nr:energy-coupling factor transport system substrate-specific component [Microbacterium sp. SORGH_AS_0862]